VKQLFQLLLICLMHITLIKCYCSLRSRQLGQTVSYSCQLNCKMIEATSCGGVVIYRGKILALYKSYKNRYEGWVLPKGTVEQGETHIQTALREVREEAGVKASVVKYIGKSHYNFTVPEDIVTKEVHWYLMTADNYHSRPQREEFFVDSGYYKFHEIYHLLRFSNEKQIVEKAYQEYLEMRSQGLWGKQHRV